MKTLIAIIKAALSKFSKINMVQYIGMFTLIITAWQQADLIQPSTVILFTGVATLILKAWQSSGELVSTGFNWDWSLWLMGIVGTVIGLLDTILPNAQILHDLFGNKTNWVVMGYLATTIILRTGFSNQSLNSISKRKKG